MITKIYNTIEIKVINNKDAKYIKDKVIKFIVIDNNNKKVNKYLKKYYH